MAIYKIQFNYRIYKYQTIPVDIEGEEMDIKVSHPIANVMEVDWEKIIHTFYPNYISIHVVGVTAKSIEQQVL
jgi:hypothetical protein